MIRNLKWRYKLMMMAQAHVPHGHDDVLWVTWTFPACHRQSSEDPLQLIDWIWTLKLKSQRARLTSVAVLWLAPFSSKYFTTSMWFSWAAMYKGVKPFWGQTAKAEISTICKVLTKPKLHLEGIHTLYEIMPT